MDTSAILERTPDIMSEEELRRAEAEHHRRAMEQFLRLRGESVDGLGAEQKTVGELSAAAEAEAVASPVQTTPAPTGASAAERVAEYSAQYTPEPRGELFANVRFRDGKLYFNGVPEAPVSYEAPAEYAAPAGEASALSSPTLSAAPDTVTDEDIRPTPRTMGTLIHPSVQTEEGEAAAVRPSERLSRQTKLVLAAVVAFVLLAIAAICICSGVLGSINADIASYRLQLEELSSTSQALRSQIGSMIDPANVDEYARTVLGMIRG